MINVGFFYCSSMSGTESLRNLISNLFGMYVNDL